MVMRESKALFNTCYVLYRKNVMCPVLLLLAFRSAVLFVHLATSQLIYGEQANSTW